MKDRSSRIALKMRQIAGRLRMAADYDYVPSTGTIPPSHPVCGRHWTRIQ
jgi:hypothetical protein